MLWGGDSGNSNNAHGSFFAQLCEKHRDFLYAPFRGARIWAARSFQILVARLQRHGSESNANYAPFHARKTKVLKRWSGLRVQVASQFLCSFGRCLLVICYSLKMIRRAFYEMDFDHVKAS